MIPLNSILVSTDFSAAANNAVHRAALLAARHNARMTLLHVVDPSALERRRAWFATSLGITHRVAVARAALSGLAAEVADRHGVHATEALQVGRPLEHLSRMAERADLLVIASRHVGPLSRLIHGNPTEQLLRVVQQPVLVVKQSALEQYRRVLVAVDLDAEPEAMLRSASALAPAAALHVLHALSSRRVDRLQANRVPAAIIRDVRDGERQRGMARLQTLLTAIGLSGAQASVEHGEAPRLTLKNQHAIAADLIVLGKNGPSSFFKFLSGDVRRPVLSSATCDVLVMPKAALRGRVRLPASGTWLDAGPRNAFEPANASHRVSRA